MKNNSPLKIATYMPLQDLYEASKEVLLALQQGKPPQDLSKLQEAIARAEELPKEREEYAKEIELARADTDEELEIDDLPFTSAADDGVWVSSWMWVPYQKDHDIEDEIA